MRTDCQASDLIPAIRVFDPAKLPHCSNTPMPQVSEEDEFVVRVDDVIKFWHPHRNGSWDSGWEVTRRVTRVDSQNTLGFLIEVEGGLWLNSDVTQISKRERGFHDMSEFTLIDSAPQVSSEGSETDDDDVQVVSAKIGQATPRPPCRGQERGRRDGKRRARTGATRGKAKRARGGSA